MIIGPLLQTKNIGRPKETFDQMHADALRCRQLQHIEQDNTLEQRADEVIRGWEQKTKACKLHIFNDSEQNNVDE